MEIQPVLSQIRAQGFRGRVEGPGGHVQAANLPLLWQGHGGRRPVHGQGPRGRGGGEARHRCRAAAASRVGELVSVHVIPRPHGEVEYILPTLETSSK